MITPALARSLPGLPAGFEDAPGDYMHVYTVNRPDFISYNRQSGWNRLQPVVKICNRLQKIATVPALINIHAPTRCNTYQCIFDNDPVNSKSLYTCYSNDHRRDRNSKVLYYTNAHNADRITIALTLITYIL